MPTVTLSPKYQITLPTGVGQAWSLYPDPGESSWRKWRGKESAYDLGVHCYGRFCHYCPKPTPGTLKLSKKVIWHDTVC